MHRQSRHAISCIGSPRIAAALRQYPEQAEWELQRWRYNYDILPPAHKALLSHLPAKFDAAKNAARTNAHFFKARRTHAVHAARSHPLQAMMSIYHEDNHTVAPHLAIANAAADEWMQHTPRASGADMDKVRYCDGGTVTSAL